MQLSKFLALSRGCKTLAHFLNQLLECKGVGESDTVTVELLFYSQDFFENLIKITDTVKTNAHFHKILLTTLGISDTEV